MRVKRKRRTETSPMIDAKGIREPVRTPPELAEAWVHEVLDAGQLSTAKLRFGRAGG